MSGTRFAVLSVVAAAIGHTAWAQTPPAPVAAAAEPATGPRSPLAPRTNESGWPLTANQRATGLDTLSLALRVDPNAATIAGDARYEVTALGPMDRLEFDLDPRYAVSRVELNGAPVAADHWRNDKGQLSIDLPAPLVAGAKVAVRIVYAGQPHIAVRSPWLGGILWSRTPDGQPWIATANQGEGCDLVWPCIDNDQKRVGRTDVAYTVPAPLVAAGNGRLVGKSEEGGWTTWRWQARDLNSYALTLNIGPFEKVESTYRSRFGNSFPLVFYHLPGHGDKPAALLAEMARAMDFFERTIGPYPFGDEKAGLVETPHLGMEHQTLNGYGNNFKPSPEGFDWLMQHEFGHEWFANQLSQSEQKHMWLQEGLDTYMQPLILMDMRGTVQFWSYLWEQRKKIVSRVPLVPEKALPSSYYNDKEAGWGGDIYYKGSWIAHTLRGLIGDRAFYASLRELVYGRPDPKPGNFRPVFRTTEDFERIASKASGRDLKWFFDAYLRQAALPRLSATVAGDTLRLAWITEGGTPFPMPVDVRVGGRVVTVAMADGTGSVALGADRGDWLLDPATKLLRDDPAITAWQAAEKAKAAEAKK